MKKILLTLMLATTTALSGHAETIVALTSQNRLLFFDSATPGNPFAAIGFTGIPNGENLVGFDYRPATGGLYALSDMGRLYLINASSGVATQINSNGLVPVGATAYGFAFNAVVDRIRVTVDTDQNYRLDPDTGGVAGTDTPLQYAGMDPHAGANPNVVGSAYTNSFAGALVTVLYDIDSNLDILAIQNPPNNGTLNTVGPLGVDTSNVVGFDISAVTGVFYASLAVANSRNLYTINQVSGAATLVGTIGGTLGPETVIDIAVPSTARILNISTRGRVSPGDDVLIGGFIIRGGESSTIVIRGIGPSLAGAGISGPLPDPVLTLRDSNGIALATNDNWQSSPQAGQITTLGLAPSSPLESAILTALSPGSYTAIVAGKGADSGLGLVEVYHVQ